MPSVNVAERLRRNSVLNPDTGCWEWMRHRSKGGYGRTAVDGKLMGAHRVSYEEFVEPIPPGLVIDHICRNRACINPAHLRAVTHKVNSTENVIGIGWQMKLANEACPSGHAFDEENTRLSPAGHRECRECDRLKHQAQRDARRGA